MKKLLLSLFLLLSTISIGQTVIEFDNMETSSTNYLLAGWWYSSPLSPNGGVSTWANNASVSPSNSAVIYGAGNGSSLLEQNFYSLPNVSLNSNYFYQLKFKVASYTFTGPTAATRGLDLGDFIEVQISTNGGISYTPELRILGNSNATWPFTATGSITHTANGSYTNSSAPVGDVYTSPAGATTTGYSTVTLNLPFNISQVAIDILCRVNSSGEEWWLDNIQLIENYPLPIELYTFEGSSIDDVNLITWSTASEHNNDYFILDRSTDGENWTTINKTTGMGNSTELIKYSYLDNSFGKRINYYRLTQVDFDGLRKTYGPIMIDNRSTKIVVKCINSLGQEVDENEKGILFLIYNDGTIEKVVR
jgi:hypothetical protein